MAEGLKSHGRAAGEYLSGGIICPPSCWDRVDWSPLSEGACAPLAPLVPPSLNMTQSVAENVWSLYTNEFQKVEKLNFSVKSLIHMDRNITTGKFICDLCDGGQYLPRLVGIGLRFLKIYVRPRSYRSPLWVHPWGMLDAVGSWSVNNRLSGNPPGISGNSLRRLRFPVFPGGSSLVYFSSLKSGLAD